MSEFKVGDKVRLKKGLKVGATYGGVGLLGNMCFKGEKEIRKVYFQNKTVDFENIPF